MKEVYSIYLFIYFHFFIYLVTHETLYNVNKSCSLKYELM